MYGVWSGLEIDVAPQLIYPVGGDGGGRGDGEGGGGGGEGTSYNNLSKFYTRKY